MQSYRGPMSLIGTRNLLLLCPVPEKEDSSPALRDRNDGTRMATPVPIKIKLAGENGTLGVQWSDRHASAYPYKYLRDHCPCATCTGAHGTEPQKSNYSNPSPFPMFKPALKMDSVEPVGQYAIRIYWNDGHSTGIYSFDHLRNICPCEQCKSTKTQDG